MENLIVRLSLIELNNIKNVKVGKIEMPFKFKRQFGYDSSEVLGLYGQNGSGKTAAIDTLYYLQQIMNGNSIVDEFVDYVDNESETATIQTEFCIYGNNLIYEVEYKILFRKTRDGKIQIYKESLSYAKTQNSIRTKKITLLEYCIEDKDNIFLPKKRLNEIMEQYKDQKMNLIVAKKIAKKTKISYIFGESSREIFSQSYKNDFKDCSIIIQTLYMFSVKDLFVIRNSHSGVISANIVLPMAFRIDDINKGFKGDFTIPLGKAVVLDFEQAEILEHIVCEIDTVLSTIIPGIKLNVKKYGPQLTEYGKEGQRLELVSIRGKVEIPIRMESEGIIKIISILNAMIQAFYNPSICLVIDELDSGIFEYLLGEILLIFSQGAKGQLLFTSHNLRALEMLENESIMFSTSNPDNRFIHMKHKKNSKNLRDAYLRCITLGGQSEIIYDETDSLRISRAFRKAVRYLNNDK